MQCWRGRRGPACKRRSGGGRRQGRSAHTYRRCRRLAEQMPRCSGGATGGCSPCSSRPQAGGPVRGCAPAALSRGAVAPPCAPWPADGVGARSAPTNRRALAAWRRTRSFALECEAEERSLPPLGLLVDDPVDVSKAVHIRIFCPARSARPAC